MTVASATNRKTFAGDDLTTDFGTSPIVFFDSSDLVLYLVDAAGVPTSLTENTHYTVAGGSGSTGTVTMLTAPASGETLVITRIMPVTQETDFVNNDINDAEVQEDALDKLTMIAQQHEDTLDRTITIPASDIAGLATELPDAVTRASKVMGFTSTGDVAVSDTTLVQLDAAVSSFVNATGNNAASILYDPAGTGAAQTTVQAKLRQWVSVKDFGAVGDGASDDTTAIQAAITAVQGSATLLYFPAGTYKVTSTLNVTGAVHFFGAGRFTTAIAWTSTTLNVLSISTTSACIIEGLNFSGPASASAGAAITVTAASNSNSFSIFRNLAFSQGYDHIKTVKAYAWVIENCYFYGQVHYAVTVENQDNVDAGDSTITKCVFSGGGASSSCIIHNSSGGLRVVNNKLLSGEYGYRMSLASGATTSDLLINGNSFESQTIAAISAGTNGGGASYSQLVIVGNQIALVPTGINLNDSTAFLSRINITGNTIALNASGTAGITITNATIFNVSGNIVTGGGGTPIGITTGANCTLGQIGLNQYSSLTTNVSVDSTSVTVLGPGPTLLAQMGVAISAPADTNENALATITIPAHLLGKNGSIRGRLTFSITNGADDKTLRVRYSAIGGTAIVSTLQTTVGVVEIDFVMHNRDATNSQVTSALALTDTPAAVAPAVVTSAIDTTANTTLVITGQKETGGDTITLERYSIEIFPSIT